jgi:hypothetical protein
VKQWLRRFREGDTSCEDRNRAGIPLTILGDVTSKFLAKHPFASPKNIASHFDISILVVKDLLSRELGLRKFTRGWVPHSLSERQKNERVTQSRLLLDLLQRYPWPISMRLQPETSHGSDMCIQLALYMADPEVTSLLASTVESAHQQLWLHFLLERGS